VNEVVVEGTPVNLNTLKKRQFCNNQVDRDRCAELVRNGEKRATSSLYDAYFLEGEALPEKGELNTVVNWSGEEQCIIKVTDVYHVFRADKYVEVEKVSAHSDVRGDEIADSLAVDAARR